MPNQVVPVPVRGAFWREMSSGKKVQIVISAAVRSPSDRYFIFGNMPRPVLVDYVDGGSTSVDADVFTAQYEYVSGARSAEEYDPSVPVKE